MTASKEGKLTEPAQRQRGVLSHGAAGRGREQLRTSRRRAASSRRSCSTAPAPPRATARRRRWTRISRRRAAGARIRRTSRPCSRPAPAARARSEAGQRRRQRPDAGPLQAKLKRTRYVAPEYPERALTQKHRWRRHGGIHREHERRADGRARRVGRAGWHVRSRGDRRREALALRAADHRQRPQEVPARTTIRFALPSAITSGRSETLHELFGRRSHSPAHHGGRRHLADARDGRRADRRLPTRHADECRASRRCRRRASLQTYPNTIAAQLNSLRDRLESRAYAGQALADLRATVDRFDKRDEAPRRRQRSSTQVGAGPAAVAAVRPGGRSGGRLHGPAVFGFGRGRQLASRAKAARTTQT